MSDVAKKQSVEQKIRGLFMRVQGLTAADLSLVHGMLGKLASKGQATQGHAIECNLQPVTSA
jgi:hypothetical protein